jgi:hypothetical protein
MDSDRESPENTPEGNPEKIKLSPKLDMAVSFLRLHRPGGPWVLTAIHPDSGKIKTQTFTDIDQARKFIATHNIDHNIYYTLNPTKGPMDSKPTKSDIAEAAWVHNDLDPKGTATSDAAKKRYLDQLRNYEHKSTFLIDSGNGVQSLWRIDPPVQPDLAAEPEERFAGVEAASRALMVRFGSKAGTQNIDRILRLPGTINWPTPAKRKVGRVACMSRLIKHNDLSYPFEVFAVTGPGTPEGGGQHERQPVDDDDDDLEQLIRTGGDVPVGERSHKVWKLTCELLRRRCPPAAVRSTLRDKANGISAHILAQKNSEAYIQKQIVSARRQLPIKSKSAQSRYDPAQSRHSRCQSQTAPSRSLPKS